MNDTILISSTNFNGQLSNVVFKPDNSFDVINLGDVLLPFLFEPNLLTPPREVYGVYTILVINSDCPNFLTVVRPIPSPTPTPTPTSTPTPTPTSTPTPTPTSTPCPPQPTKTPKPTKTPTPTPTPTPSPTFDPCVTPTPTVTPIVIEGYLLQENGFLILQEDGGKIIIT